MDNSKDNLSAVPIFYQGEIAAKFSGPITEEYNHSTHYHMDLYDARVVYGQVINKKEDLVEKDNTFRCNNLPVRLYLGASRYFIKETLYNVWIQNVEISKTRVIDGQLYGVLRGDFYGTTLNPDLKQSERLKGDPWRDPIGEKPKEGPISPDPTKGTGKPDPGPGGKTDPPQPLPLWSWSWWPWNWAIWDWFFYLPGCLGNLWAWFWYILLFMLIMRGCDRLGDYIDNTSETSQQETDDSDNKKEYDFSEADLDELTKDELENDSLNVCSPAITKHNWYDYTKNSQTVNLPYCFNDVKRSTTVRKRKDVRTFGTEYSNIILHDFPKLKKTIAVYKDMAVAQNLDKKQLADLVVSSVQSMEYWIVHQGDHQVMANSYRKYYREYCMQNKCLPFIDNFGVLAPLEFLKLKRGDCDSRTVFLYAVLNGLSIDTTILNSDSHSIIGVAGVRPDQNDYIKINNKRYYVWETTAEGWRLGQFPKGSGALHQFKPVHIQKT